MPYCPLTAQALYKERREACHPYKRLEHAPLHSYIQICILEYHWSPEEIVGRIQLEHGCRLVSVSTIYRAIHAGLLNQPGASAKFVLRKLRRHKKGVVEGGVGNPLALAVSQRRKTAGTLIFDDLEPFL